MIKPIVITKGKKIKNEDFSQYESPLCDNISSAKPSRFRISILNLMKK
jgi:hypothetical protein